mgnify:CR=1 FL=1
MDLGTLGSVGFILTVPALVRNLLFMLVGIAGIDTRALTRHLRTRGAMRAGIFSGEQADLPRAAHALRAAGHTLLD